jgi:hypothetical protein
MGVKKEPLSKGVVQHKKERGFCPANSKESYRGLMMSDVVLAAIKNIQLHITENPKADNELLEEWALPQLNSVFERLTR